MGTITDLISNTGQQRNVVMHPHFVNGKYMVYTRPQDGYRCGFWWWNRFEVHYRYDKSCGRNEHIIHKSNIILYMN